MKRLVITQLNYKEYPCLAIVEDVDGKIMKLHLDEPKKENLLGSIHVGKVQKVLPNINGAFVEIENRVPCFYPYKKQASPIHVRNQVNREIKPGDEILVQVTQEALKTKSPCVSSNLNFIGNYLVLTTENHLLGISGKLSNEKKAELKQMIEPYLESERSFGVIVRTNAKDATQEELVHELESLKREYEQVLRKAQFSPCFKKIKAGDSSIIQKLKHVYWNELEKIVTDDKEIYEEISSYLQQIEPVPTCEVQYYEDKLLPLYKLYRIEHGIEQALSEKVWLKSGGFLMIQQTEAFVVIDVNSGKNASKKEADEEVKKLNLEAAREIARQIQLRNLYGIILIDFVNMNQYEDQKELIRAMKNFTREDTVQTSVVDITSLGIMEVTRKKEEKSFSEQLRQIIGHSNA